VRTYQYNEDPFWPWEIKIKMADILVRLGNREEAAALAMDAWQHRGPQGSRGGRPPQPRRWAEQADLFDLAVVLQQQRLRAAELRGDAEETRKALDDLEDLVEDAQSQRTRAVAWQEFLQRAAREPASDKLLDVEKRALRYIRESLPARRAAYADFCRRVDDGWYDAVRVDEPRDFKNLAKSWRGIADSTWSDWWDLERGLSHLLTFQAQVPPTTKDEEEDHRERLERFVTVRFRP
jgi:hypothetical protein